jgi:hypothetical protein
MPSTEQSAHSAPACYRPDLPPCYKAGMRHALRLHPDSLCFAATQIEVEVSQPHAGGLVFAYFVTGRIDALRIPPATPATRADQLWQTTCFEAFLRPSAGPAYYEFNFAPSSRWAAYRFESYRDGMRDVTELSAPRIDVRTSPELFTLEASLQLDPLLASPRDATWRLGLSAMIEEASGRKSYWALTHPPGKADFHHSDCFAQEIAPA